MHLTSQFLCSSVEQIFLSLHIDLRAGHKINPSGAV